MDHHLELASKIQSEKSTLTPIFTLPVETTSEIFQLAQVEYDFGELSGEGCSWIAMSHVCRSWRNIAIGTPTLWTTIFTGKLATKEITELFLERSSDCPLTVYHFGRTFLDHRCLCLVLQHLHRIQEIRIYEMIERDTEDVISLIRKPAPILKTFTLMMRSSSGLDVGTLFSGAAPKLEELWLDAPVSSWSNFPNYGNLKSLYFGSHMTPPTLDEALGILATNPNITNLGILHLRANELEEDPKVSPISLPCLKKLKMDSVSSNKVLEQLFSVIVFPKIQSYTIDCERPSDVPNSCIFASKLETVDHRTALLVQVDRCAISIRAKGDGEDRPSCSILYNWSIIDSSPFFAEKMEAVVPLLENGHFSTATELFVSFGKDYSGDMSASQSLEQAWIEFLRPLPNIEKITVMCTGHIFAREKRSKDSYKDLLRVLSRTHSPEYRSAATEFLVCRNLKEVDLDGFDHSTGEEALTEMITVREKHGYRTRVLGIAEAATDA